MTKFGASLNPHSSILLKGKDAWDYGQRLFSRNLKTIALGECIPSLFLSAEGKVQSMFWVVKQEQALLLIVENSQKQRLKETIEKYHFAEAFETLDGPAIAGFWASLDTSTSEISGVFRGTRYIFKLEEPSSQNSGLKEWDLHRIQNLIPEYGKDWDENTLVFDLGLEEICDEDKGCYIGQEVVERVRTRGGHGPRRLALLSWAEPPKADSIFLDSSDEKVGSTTSSTVQTKDGTLGLGFVKRGTSTIYVMINPPEGKAISGKILKII